MRLRQNPEFVKEGKKSGDIVRLEGMARVGNQRAILEAFQTEYLVEDRVKFAREDSARCFQCGNVAMFAIYAIRFGICFHS